MNRVGLDIKIKTFEPEKRGGFRGGDEPIRKQWLQWNLLSLFLLICASAAWFQYYRLAGDNDRMRARIEMMRAELKPLTVVHADRVAVVKAPRNWMQAGWDQAEKWKIALPTRDAVDRGGAAYNLCVATSGLRIGSLPAEVTEFAMPQGRHTLEIMISETETGYEVKASLDDEQVLRVSQLHAFGATRTGAGAGGSGEQSYQPESVTDSVALYTAFYDAGPGLPIQKPCNGVQVWLKPIR